MNATLLEMTEDDYEAMLNDCYPDDITICGLTYSAGRVLRKIDPIAFRCGISAEPEQWKCKECRSIYNNEDEAEDCYKEKF